MEWLVEKFAALFVTTTEIATEALKLPFVIDSPLAFLKEYDQENGSKRDTSSASYDVTIQICRSQSHKFFVRQDKSLPKVHSSNETASAPVGECWSRITNIAKDHIGGRMIVQEF